MSPRRPSNQDHLDALEFLLTDATAIAQLADDWQEGFPAGGSEGRGPTGSHSDRVANSIIARDDPCHVCGGDTPCLAHPNPRADQVWVRREGHGLADRAQQILHTLDQVKAQLAWARREWARLRPSDHDVAEAKARSLDATRTAGVGHCQVAACDEFCTGGTNDRLKSGMCPKHYIAWWRNLRADEPLSRDKFLAQADGCMVTDESAGCA